jgi:hypothetical protein
MVEESATSRAAVFVIGRLDLNHTGIMILLVSCLRIA